jgi:hypothetical protein
MAADAPHIICPFTILVDSAEGQPFTFQGIRADADKMNLPLLIKTERSNLGRHPNSLGDYAIAGLIGHVAIERKSMDDCWGTVLGWATGFHEERGIAGRRERFESELANLSRLPAPLVVVEASLEQCIDEMPEWGVKPQAENKKIFMRSIISFEQRFKVNWHFLSSRRAAEVWAFRWMERYWKKLTKRERQEAIERAGTA